MVDENNTHEENDVVMEEEVQPEDLELDEEEGVLKDKITSLRAKLKTCEEDKRSALEDLQRARADFLNSRRRLEEQLERDKERITEKHIESLLPLADSFEMAMKDPAWAEADGTWKKGIEGIHGQLMSILAQYGVTAFDPHGEEFDPHQHEALSDSGNGTKIGVVIQKGYKMKERVLRPAKVAVGEQ